MEKEMDKFEAIEEVKKEAREICELRQDNRRLSKQVEDGVDRMRKAGVI